MWIIDKAILEKEELARGVVSSLKMAEECLREAGISPPKDSAAVAILAVKILDEAKDESWIFEEGEEGEDSE